MTRSSGEPWTEEEIRRAAEMWADGHSGEEIGRTLGRSRSGTLAIMARNRRLFPKRGQPKPETEYAGGEDVIRQAAKMWVEGKSARAIGDALGMTPNQISGIAAKRREMFPKRGKGSKTKTASKSPRKSAQVVPMRPQPKPAPQPRPRPEEPLPAAVATADAFKPLPGSEPVLLWEIGAFQCHWPVGEGDPMAETFTRFCGCRVASPKLSYCAVHQRLSEGEGTRGERDAIRAAKRAA
ncbi:GcrA family cell cycle regulator [Consotaella aegiceratis]|uniref:GcrA family cell cycle regulator n=1 Tax=Consotaella aegiceratis TaxID=3097961 RepID=UPI002F3EF337